MLACTLHHHRVCLAFRFVGVPSHGLSTPAYCNIHIKGNNKNIISTTVQQIRLDINNVLDSSFDAAIAHSW
jgi:hypothetical protein